MSLFSRKENNVKTLSAGNALCGNNVPTKLSCTARHKSDDLNDFIKFRISKSLKSEAQKQFGKSLSAVLRQLLCSYIDAETLPTRQQANDLKKLAVEAHKIGVNLNQTTKALNADPKNAKRIKEVMELIKDLACLKEIALDATRGMYDKKR